MNMYLCGLLGKPMRPYNTSLIKLFDPGEDKRSEMVGLLLLNWPSPIVWRWLQGLRNVAAINSSQTIKGSLCSGSNGKGICVCVWKEQFGSVCVCVCGHARHTNGHNIYPWILTSSGVWNLLLMRRKGFATKFTCNHTPTAKIAIIHEVL